MNADPDVLNVNSTRPMSAARLPSGRKYPILYTVSPSEVGGNEAGLALLGITLLICTNRELPRLLVLFIKKGGESSSETQALRMRGAVNYA